MREFAEAIALEINARTEFEAQVTTKGMPDGTERYGVAVREVGSAIAPTVYVEQFKKAGLSVEDAMAEVLKLYDQYKVPDINMEWYMDFENVKEKLFVKLLPPTFDAEVSRSAKAYGFEDLILVPYVKVEGMPLGNGAIKVLNQHIEKWGVTKRTVIDTAVRNTKKEEIYIQSLASFMEEVFPGEMELPEELFGPMIVSNKEKTFGASAVLGKINELKKMYKDGFFILPSSVHEVLVLPKQDGMVKGFFDDMVRQVNATEVLPEEVLANHAYEF